MSKKNCVWGILSWSMICLAQPVMAGVGAADGEALQARVEVVLADPEATRAAAAAGRERGLVCAYCHGQDGNSPKPIVPHVAGQNPDYLVTQFHAYAEGTRQDYIMQGMLRDFSPDDVVNVTVFYATQTRQVAAASDLGQADRGGILYQGMCESCHEVGGRGGEGYPWIAAQSDQYLVRALERYRDAGTGRGKRNDPDMVAISSKLSDQNIQDLASYLANLQ